MDFASVTARHRPNLQGQRPAVSVNPLRHLSHLQGLSLLIDLKAVHPNNTKVERADFVLKDLEVSAQEVLSIFVDHVTQLLVLTVETEAAFNIALERLHAGVPWAAADGAAVYGSASTDAVSAVRVSNIPSGLSIPFVINHMKKFGTILNSNIGRDRLFPRATDGILHLTMVLHDAANLPHFIQVVDDNGLLSNSLPVHMDSPRRCCYRCGRLSHLGYRCQASTRAPDAPASIWSTLVAPPAPVPEAAASGEGVAKQKPPAVDRGSSQLELNQLEAVALTGPPPVTPATTQSDSNTSTILNTSSAIFTAPAAPLGGLKRPLPLSLPSSLASEGGRSTSPMTGQSDLEFTTFSRSRARNKKKREDKLASSQRSVSRSPLASRAPLPSALEDIILQPRMEEEPSNGSTSN